MVFTAAVFLPSATPAKKVPLDREAMRQISGREGIDFQFNLSLGSEFGEMDLAVQDGDGHSGSDGAFLGLENIWLTFNVGATNSSHNILIDIFQEPALGSSESSLRLYMNDSAAIAGIQGHVDRAAVKTNIGGCCGNDVAGLELGNGSGSPGTLNLDGGLHFFGAPD